MPADAIVPFLARVATAQRASLVDGCERGFLAYWPGAPGAPLVAEEDGEGSADEIRWRWERRDATVAFSFHTHPGPRAACVPSGIDAVGALIRGDHLIYVVTPDGRVAGWRFRDPRGHAWAVADAVDALDDGGKLRRGLVDFLYDSFDALRPRLLAPAYAGRLTLAEDGGCALARAKPDASFFTSWERANGAA